MPSPNDRSIMFQFLDRIKCVIEIAAPAALHLTENDLRHGRANLPRHSMLRHLHNTAGMLDSGSYCGMLS